jgi:hypothetical protein
MDLSDNILIQFLSVFSLGIILLQWLGIFIKNGFDSSLLPAFGNDYSEVIGGIMFNYSTTYIINSKPS